MYWDKRPTVFVANIESHGDFSSVIMVYSILIIFLNYNSVLSFPFMLYALQSNDFSI